MHFTDLFIRRPVLATVVSLLILLIGLRAAMVLPIRQYPKLSNTVVNVTTVYPGASANLIQGFMSKRGQPFGAYLVLSKTGAKAEFEFPPR